MYSRISLNQIEIPSAHKWNKQYFLLRQMEIDARYRGPLSQAHQNYQGVMEQLRLQQELPPENRSENLIQFYKSLLQQELQRQQQLYPAHQDEVLIELLQSLTR